MIVPPAIAIGAKTHHKARRHLLRSACQVALALLSLACELPQLSASESDSAANFSTIAEIERRLADSESQILTFRLEGTVCATLPQSNLLALQDASGAEFFEIVGIDPALQPGDLVRIEGDRQLVTRSRRAIQLGTGPVVDVDGVHGFHIRAGQVYLDAGWQPIRLDWFNATGEFALSVEYEGPGLPKQWIPDSALASPEAADQTLHAGLHFTSYNGNEWHVIPDLARLSLVSQGVTPNFNLACRARDEQTALEFTGRISISLAGIYTFYLGSDDGSRLFVGGPGGHVNIRRLNQQAAPRVAPIEEIFQSVDASKWGRIEGSVSFASRDGDGLELELGGVEPRGRITVLDYSAASIAGLLHKRIAATGICRGLQDRSPDKNVYLTAPDIRFLDLTDAEKAPADSAVHNLLTSIGQIKCLKPAEAARALPARLQGVVIWVSATAVVIQDYSGGAYVRAPEGSWEKQPAVGELWEVEGKTDAGDFSPMIHSHRARFLGAAAMPIPVQASWAQLMNGSLDAEYVELRGLVTAISDKEVSLLTPDGMLRIVAVREHPLPQFFAEPPSAPGGRSLLNSVVRMRGCLTALWDFANRQVKVGEIMLTPATVEVEDSGPADPFTLPTKSASDLLHFDAQANSLQRTKVSGLVTCARAPLYYFTDHGVNLRLVVRGSSALHPGDLIDAVGFPQLGGPSPVLREAQVKVTGRAPLPRPTSVPPARLAFWKKDGARARVEATLLSDVMQGHERTLELQVDRSHFLATLPMNREVWQPLAPQTEIALTGLCATTPIPGVSESTGSFTFLLNEPGDIVVTQLPSWWTVRHALIVISILLAGLGGSAAWIGLLRREVESRTLQWRKEIEERKRAEQKQAMEQERARVAQDLHDELGVGLTQVGMLGALAKNPALPEERKRHCLDQLTEAAQSLVTGLDEIVWAVNPKYDSAASLGTYYSLFAQRFLNLAGIACRFDSNDGLPELAMDSQMRHGVFLAFKEALNNIARHSQATEARLKIAIDDLGLMIAVTDNGRGFATDNLSPGMDGLANMRRRMERLGGSCTITSHPGQGASVELRLRLTR